MNNGRPKNAKFAFYLVLVYPFRRTAPTGAPPGQAFVLVVLRDRERKTDAEQSAFRLFLSRWYRYTNAL